MKILFYLCMVLMVLSCSVDDASSSSQTVELFVNHYQTTNVLSGLSYVVQEDEAIGSERFTTLDRIGGFDFEPGSTYRLRTRKTRIKNAGTNAITLRYELLEIIAKQEVQPGTRFRIPLSTAVPGQGMVSFLKRTADSTFVLGGQIPIICRSYCGNLNVILEERLPATGTFSHGPADTYILEELED